MDESLNKKDNNLLKRLKDPSNTLLEKEYSSVCIAESSISCVVFILRGLGLGCTTYY